MLFSHSVSSASTIRWWRIELSGQLWSEAERNFEDGIHLDGRAVARSGFELPLGECFFSTLIEAGVYSAQQLDRIHVAIFPNDAGQPHLAFHFLVHGRGQVFGIDLANREWSLQI